MEKVMEVPKIFESEYKLCLILWDNEPIGISNLAKLANSTLGWSRTTTYTVVKHLCDRGVFLNSNSTITSLFSKEEVQMSQMSELIDKTFEGSLPAFINAFARKQNLSDKEYKQLEKMIRESRK